MKLPRSMTFLLLLAMAAAVPTSSSNSLSMGDFPGGRRHFVLVHGACHGAWSWYKMLPLLTSAGHDVTAIDLAASGVEPRQVEDVRTISQYTQPLRDYVASLPPTERVILVAHSYGGFAIAQAMELFPGRISVAVFVSAFMPGPSYPASTLFQEVQSQLGPQLDNLFRYENGSNNSPATLTFGPKYLLRYMYQLSPIQDWVLATTLMRQFRFFYLRDLIVTQMNYGSVKRVYIVSEKDIALYKQLQEMIIVRSPPDEVLRISTSDHMVMLSEPLKLRDRLLDVAQRYT